MQLSKSDYMLFLKHPAWLWLKKHEPAKLPEVDDDLQAIFDAGNLFESYAEQLFPDGIRLGFENPSEYSTLPLRTLEALKTGAKTIFQARFEAKDITCIHDVLVRVDDKTFDVYEIKSSTKVKPEHIYDLAFQREVLTIAGYKVSKMFVVHVNNKYVRDGEIDVKEFAVITEVTDKVFKKQEETKANITEALRTINLKKIPDTSPSLANLGSCSEWLPIFKALEKVDKYSIYNLCSPNAKKIGELEKLGIKKISDIPDDFPLNPKQRLQVEVTKKDKQIINKDQVRDFLAKLKFPLYFLDYETFGGLVPYFDGLKPYDQVPFQYSLHVLETPDSKPKHFKYLHKENSNSAEQISKSLTKHIGKEGTVLAWHDCFEKSCNKTLAKLAPKYESFFDDINERMIDLKIPFSEGYFVDKDFFGSASIKIVLPALIPELSYADLDIYGGATAQRLWMEAILDGKRDGEKEKILSDLQKYCDLDTLAMVEIYKYLCNSCATS